MILLHFILPSLLAVKQQNRMMTKEPITPEGSYCLLQTINRPADSYTQGLKMLDNSRILESSGLYGESSIQIINLDKYQTELKRQLPPTEFGEGCINYKNKEGKLEIQQLTWKERKIYRYDDKLNFIEVFQMPQQMSQGWGLTKRIVNGNLEFWVSDSSNLILIVDPYSWKVTGERHVYKLNDMTFIHGKLYANVFLENYIVKVNPDTGIVEEAYDLSPLVDEWQNSSVFIGNNFGRGECLNGIDYLEGDNGVYVTGKKWNKIHKIQFKEPGEKDCIPTNISKV